MPPKKSEDLDVVLQDLSINDTVEAPSSLPDNDDTDAQDPDSRSVASDSDSSGEWQEMDAVASHNIYNKEGRLDLRSYDELAESSNKAASFEYTKVAAEAQAQRSYETNKKTDFLFDHKRLRKLNGSHPSQINLHSPSPDEFDEFYDEFEDEATPLEDLNPENQLNVTKLLLSDREKFAYLGAVNLLANQMCSDLAKLCLCVDVKAHRRLAYRLQFTQRDMAAWKTLILDRLYTHLDVYPEEITMIEKLALHEIAVEDVCKCLKTTHNIENPWENSSTNPSTVDLNDVDRTDANAESIVNAHTIKKDSVKHPASSEAISENDRISMESPASSVDVAYSSTQSITEKIEDAQASQDLKNCKLKEVIGPDKIKDTKNLDIDVAWTIICDLFLLLLQTSSYDSRSRTLLINFAKALHIRPLEICEFEKRVTDSLDMEQSTEDQVWDEQDHMKARRKRKRRKKMAYVGLAMVGGSLVLGLSGGLLAPVIGAGIAAGLSTIGVTGATGFLTGVGGTTVVALSSTAIGANIGARGMSRRMGSVRSFEFKPLHNNRRVNLIISVSGWMIGNEDDVRLPFSTVDPVEGDLYSLSWEPEMLKSTGQTINIVAGEVFATTVQQVLGATILTAFMTSVQWPMMLSKLGYILDNPWNVSLDRAWSAGLILADTLISRNLGQRPVTLMGFSLGSRVIYSCLIELCKRNALGLVENVFLFGTPVVRKKEQLVMARSVVSGRFVNGYSDKDWLLAYLFRATAGGFSAVMGISTVEDIDGIENFNCTEIVDGHMNYRKNIPQLLKKLGIAVLSEEFAEIEETIDPAEFKRQKKLVRDIDAAQKKLSDRKKSDGWVPKWLKPKKTKWQAMVEESFEDNKDTLDDTIDIGTKERRKNSALVDHGALIRELEKIKAAMKEQEDSKATEAPSYEGSEISRVRSTEKKDTKSPRNSDASSVENSGPIHGQNTFQLLNAGKRILPEDDESVKKNVEYAYPDDL